MAEHDNTAGGPEPDGTIKRDAQAVAKDKQPRNVGEAPEGGNFPDENDPEIQDDLDAAPPGEPSD